MDYTKNRFKFITTNLLMFICSNICSGQISRKEMMSYYKFVFLETCTETFEIDKGYREEVCGLYFDGLDKKSYIEIDSMSAICANNINVHVKEINESSDGNADPTRGCVLKYCLDQYDSDDMDKMAKRFARRMKNVNPINYKNY